MAGWEGGALSAPGEEGCRPWGGSWRATPDSRAKATAMSTPVARSRWERRWGRRGSSAPPATSADRVRESGSGGRGVR